MEYLCAESISTPHRDERYIYPVFVINICRVYHIYQVYIPFLYHIYSACIGYLYASYKRSMKNYLLSYSRIEFVSPNKFLLLACSLVPKIQETTPAPTMKTPTTMDE